MLTSNFIVAMDHLALDHLELAGMPYQVLPCTWCEIRLCATGGLNYMADTSASYLNDQHLFQGDLHIK